MMAKVINNDFSSFSPIYFFLQISTPPFSNHQKKSGDEKKIKLEIKS